MILTWNSIFFILSSIWDMKQSDIAKHLDYSPSAVSLLASGKSTTTRYKHDEIFHRLFDPAKSGHPAHGRTHKSMLGYLKTTLEDAGFKYVVEDFWEIDDYKTFVIKMLQCINVDKDSEEQPPLIDQMRDTFIEFTERCKIMDIINRKPATLYRDDSSMFNAYLRKMDTLVLNPYKNDFGTNSLYVDIKTFLGMLRIQALSVEASMNSSFSYDDESVLIHMDDSDVEEEEANNENNLIPRLSQEIAAAADDPLRLLSMSVRSWGNFRNDMNFVYNEICKDRGN